jgi:AcrR family transcriptional regulator
MKTNLSSVKIEGSYHHGDLRVALMKAAEDLLTEKGVEGFSLRETARRAGVSPAAPKHHFRDMRALFTAIATVAFDDLANGLEEASGECAQDRLVSIRRQGAAYVQFALKQPARFDLMWRIALLDTEDADYRRASERAFSALDRLVRGEDAVLIQKGDAAVAPTIACWSLVHGFARLALDGAFGRDPRERDRSISALLPAVLERLSP